jgi:membrane protease YdiL (CAAX protease family)
MVGMSIAAPNAEHAWFYPPADAPHVAALLLIPFLEEIGWRGFALPRLIAKYGALPASMVLGVIWSLWHTPMFVLQGFTLEMFLLALPFFIAGSIVFSWLYLRAGGSLPVAILAHAGAHLNNSHTALPADMLPFVVHTIAYCVCAALVVALDGTPWKLARTPEPKRKSGQP